MGFTTKIYRYSVVSCILSAIHLFFLYPTQMCDPSEQNLRIRAALNQFSHLFVTFRDLMCFHSVNPSAPMRFYEPRGALRHYHGIQQ